MPALITYHRLHSWRKQSSRPIQPQSQLHFFNRENQLVRNYHRHKTGICQSYQYSSRNAISEVQLTVLPREGSPGADL
jgi:hypothetical protein